MIEEEYMYKSTVEKMIEKGFEVDDGLNIGFITHGLALKWFREVKKIHIDVDYITETNNYSFYIKPMKGCDDWFKHVNGKNTYKTWELCAEMAIMYVLKEIL